MIRQSLSNKISLKERIKSIIDLNSRLGIEKKIIKIHARNIQAELCKSYP